MNDPFFTSTGSLDYIKKYDPQHRTLRYTGGTDKQEKNTNIPQINNTRDIPWDDVDSRTDGGYNNFVPDTNQLRARRQNSEAIPIKKKARPRAAKPRSYLNDEEEDDEEFDEELNDLFGKLDQDDSDDADYEEDGWGGMKRGGKRHYHQAWGRKDKMCYAQDRVNMDKSDLINERINNEDLVRDQIWGWNNRRHDVPDEKLKKRINERCLERTYEQSQSDAQILEPFRQRQEDQQHLKYVDVTGSRKRKTNELRNKMDRTGNLFENNSIYDKFRREFPHQIDRIDETDGVNMNNIAEVDKFMQEEDNRERNMEKEASVKLATARNELADLESMLIDEIGFSDAPNKKTKEIFNTNVQDKGAKKKPSKDLNMTETQFESVGDHGLRGAGSSQQQVTVEMQAILAAARDTNNAERSAAEKHELTRIHDLLEKARNNAKGNRHERRLSVPSEPAIITNLGPIEMKKPDICSIRTATPLTTRSEEVFDGIASKRSSSQDQRHQPLHGSNGQLHSPQKKYSFPYQSIFQTCKNRLGALTPIFHGLPHITKSLLDSMQKEKVHISQMMQIWSSQTRQLEIDIRNHEREHDGSNEAKVQMLREIRELKRMMQFRLSNIRDLEKEARIQKAQTTMMKGKDPQERSVFASVPMIPRDDKEAATWIPRTLGLHKPPLPAIVKETKSAAPSLEKEKPLPSESHMLVTEKFVSRDGVEFFFPKNEANVFNNIDVKGSKNNVAHFDDDGRSSSSSSWGDNYQADDDDTEADEEIAKIIPQEEDDVSPRDREQCRPIVKSRIDYPEEGVLVTNTEKAAAATAFPPWLIKNDTLVHLKCATPVMRLVPDENGNSEDHDLPTKTSSDTDGHKVTTSVSEDQRQHLSPPVVSLDRQTASDFCGWATPAPPRVGSNLSRARQQVFDDLREEDIAENNDNTDQQADVEAEIEEIDTADEPLPAPAREDPNGSEEAGEEEQEAPSAEDISYNLTPHNPLREVPEQIPDMEPAQKPVAIKRASHFFGKAFRRLSNKRYETE